MFISGQLIYLHNINLAERRVFPSSVINMESMLNRLHNLLFPFNW